MTAAWTTHRAGSRPAPVATASPSAIGPFATASRSISSPPARLSAPATPAPIHRWSFAAFATASTSSAAMSPSTTSSESMPGTLAPGGLACARDRQLRLVGEAGQHLQLALVERDRLGRARDDEPQPAVEAEGRDAVAEGIPRVADRRDVRMLLGNEHERLRRVREAGGGLGRVADRARPLALLGTEAEGRLQAHLAARDVLQPEGRLGHLEEVGGLPHDPLVDLAERVDR